MWRLKGLYGDIVRYGIYRYYMCPHSWNIYIYRDMEYMEYLYVYVFIEREREAEREREIDG